MILLENYFLRMCHCFDKLISFTFMSFHIYNSIHTQTN